MNDERKGFDDHLNLTHEAHVQAINKGTTESLILRIYPTRLHHMSLNHNYLLNTL